MTTQIKELERDAVVKAESQGKLPNESTMTSQPAPAQASVETSALTQVPVEKSLPAQSIDAKEEESKKRGFKISKKTLLLALVLLILAPIGYQVYQHLITYQETDDAYITAHVIPISSRIEDNVDEVLIDDNEHVKRGQLIVRLDPRDFQRKVDEATATVERLQKEAVVTRGNTTLAAMNSQATRLNAQGDVSGASATIEKSESSIRECRFAIAEQEQILAQRDAELARAKLDFDRYNKLEKERAVTTSERDRARRDLDVSRAACDAARRAIDMRTAQLEEAQHQLSVAKSQQVHSQGTERSARSSEIQEHVSKLQQDVSAASIKEAQAKLNTALLQLSYCKITAPVSGSVGRKNVEIGQRVQPGGRLLTLTADDIWVVANFKENQLEKMRPGQVAEMKIDALPHETFSGVVDSFSPGSGAQFTLLPPDNATGNFTKIVQRVPVKIRFKGSIDNFREKLVPGLSATVSVNVSK
jgi:membrane fusion protein, multidrug efflux system